MSEQALLGKDGLTVRDSGIWANDKLYYLGRYLKILSVGMKNKWRGQLYYVDLFAGPGRCRIRETQEEINGSPLVALLGFDFAKYFFFEADRACFEALETRSKKRAPDKWEKVKIIPGDCNETIDQAELPSEGLGLAFIDPTGISQISFETIRRLAAGRKIDLIINFPEGMGIRMNLFQYTQTETNALTSFMGSTRWQERYQQSLTSFDQVCTEIAKEYLANLGSLGYLAVDSDRIPVKTGQNTLLYYLLFASKNPRGNDFWRKIKRIGPHGQRELPYDRET
jgi:three-Cys-motif partner protein